MQQSLKTYLLALKVAPMNVGQSYAQLPMHCTIMHRFHSVLDVKTLVAELQPLVSSTSPLELQVVEHQAFGPKKQLVSMIEPTAELLTFHHLLNDKLNLLGVQYTESDWVGDGYVPHVTDKQGKRLSVSKPTMSNAVYLISVEHPLQGSKRFIEAKIELAGKDSYAIKLK